MSPASSAITADGIGDLTIQSDAASIASSCEGSVTGVKTTAADERSLSCKSVGKQQSVMGIRKIRGPDWPAAPSPDICLTNDYGPIPWREAVTERAASVPALLGFGSVPGGFPGFQQGIQGYGMGMNGYPPPGMGMPPMQQPNFPVAARFVNPTPPMISYPGAGSGIESMSGYCAAQNAFPPPQNMFNPIQNGVGRQNIYCSGPGTFIYPRPQPAIACPPVTVPRCNGIPEVRESHHSTHESHHSTHESKCNAAISVKPTPTTRHTNGNVCQPSNSQLRNGSRHTRVTVQPIVTPPEECITGELPSYNRNRRTRTARSASLIPAYKCGKAIGFEDTLVPRAASKSRHATNNSHMRSCKSPSTVDSRRSEYASGFIPPTTTTNHVNNKVRACSNGSSHQSSSMQRSGSPTTSRGASICTPKIENKSITAPPCIRSSLHHGAAYPQPYPQLPMSGYMSPTLGATMGSTGMGASQYQTGMSSPYGMGQMAPQAGGQQYPPIPLGPASQSHVQWANCTNFDEGFNPMTASLPRRPAAM